MEIYKKGGKSFLRPNVPIITEKITQEIYKYAKNNPYPVIIDMSEVDSCVNKFFHLFKMTDIILVNTTSQMLSTIYMTGYDKYVKLFEEIVSLEDNKRQLLNRRFCIV